MTFARISHELMESAEALDTELEAFIQIDNLKKTVFNHKEVEQKRKDAVKKAKPEDRERIGLMQIEFERRSIKKNQDLITIAMDSYHLLESHIDSGKETSKALDTNFRVTFDALTLALTSATMLLVDEIQILCKNTELELNATDSHATTNDKLGFEEEIYPTEYEWKMNALNDMQETLARLRTSYRALEEINSPLETQLSYKGISCEDTEMQIRYSIITKYIERLMNGPRKSIKGTPEYMQESIYSIIREERIRQGKELQTSSQVLFAFLLELITAIEMPGPNEAK